jgi:hypothetical protein
MIDHVVLLRFHGAVTDESIDALSRAVVVLQERIDGVESVNCRAVGSPRAAAGRGLAVGLARLLAGRRLLVSAEHPRLRRRGRPEDASPVRARSWRCRGYPSKYIGNS